MNRSLRGALAGAAATVPMTVVMTAAHRALPREQQYELPPEALAHEVPRRAGAPPEAAQAARRGWLIPHVAYGAASGLAFALVFRGRRASPATGAVFGLGLWMVGYLGWIPALRLPQAGTDEPPERNAMMVAAHLVWGAATASILKRHDRRHDVHRCGSGFNELAPHRGVR